MAKISFPKPKLSSNELDRLLLDTPVVATLEAVSKDTQPVSATNNQKRIDVSATNNLAETSVSATNNSRGQYINQYKRDHYDILRISVPRGVKAALQKEAKKRNVSATNMILQALSQQFGIDVSSTNSAKEGDVSSTNNLSDLWCEEQK